MQKRKIYEELKKYTFDLMQIVSEKCEVPNDCGGCIFNQKIIVNSEEIELCDVLSGINDLPEARNLIG